MSIKEIGKRSLLYLLAVVILICILFPLFHTSSNQQALKRLDEIAERLSSIDRQLEKIDGEIIERQIKKDNLITEQTALNEEAQQLFLNLVTPEMVTSSDELSLVIQTDWQPGQLTEDQSRQEMPIISWEDSHQRFKNLMLAYWLDPSQIWTVENHYGIKEWVIGCITVAETSWGNRWAGWANIWSVGSNDRWDRPTYALMETWLEDIGKTLVNKYLWSKQTLWCLSNAGSCTEPNDNQKRYATSTSNREANMKACLETIYWEWNVDPSTFNIRR